MDTDSVTYGGVIFRRYPAAADWSSRSYYVPSASERARGVESLHREVYKHEVGPIPPGWHVHHADHDPTNNAASNLVAMPPAEHRAEHPHPDSVVSDAARAAAAVWHRSPEGRAWHADHARAIWADRSPVDRVCQQCGRPYSSTAIRQSAVRFCSDNCRAAARRASGVDDEDRVCEACGTTFRINRYSPTRNCSRTCAWVVRRR